MLRKVLVLTAALLALFATAAQAHTATATATCGQLTINWNDFATAPGANNTVDYSWSFIPHDTLIPVQSQSGQLVFPGPNGVESFTTLPKVDGTVVVSSSWTADMTIDHTAGSNAGTIAVTDCPPAQPTITTTALPASAPFGTPIADKAHLGGGDNPTGTITWKLYGPNDPTCSAAKPPTVTAPVNGDGDYTSPAITPTAAGTYEWVASYDGDHYNLGVAGSCGDPAETVTVGPPLALTTTASPASATVGHSITDVAHLSGGTSPAGTLQWALYGPNDANCSSTPVTTAVVHVSGDGDYTSPALTPTAAGTYQWVASFKSADANNQDIGPTGCAESSETVTLTAPPATPSPSFTLRKLEADPSSPNFGAGPIDANIGDTIRYEIIVTNTGNVPLSLALVDTQCTGISGPTGNVTANSVAVGGTATWTCSHVVVAADYPSYVNVAQVTATPPGGGPLPPQRSSVLANIPKGGVNPACVASPLKLKRTTSRSGQTVNVIVTGGGLKRVAFAVDGRTVKTLTKPNLSGGRYELSIALSSTRYGAHSVTVRATNGCGKVTSDGLTFARNTPVKRIVPRFTG